MQQSEGSAYNLPLRKVLNKRTNCWSIIDSADQVVAKDLTFRSADMFASSANIVGSALSFLRTFVITESCVVYKQDDKYLQHVGLRRYIVRASKYLLESNNLMIPQNYKKNLQHWGESFLPQCFENSSADYIAMLKEQLDETKENINEGRY